MNRFFIFPGFAVLAISFCFTIHTTSSVLASVQTHEDERKPLLLDQVKITSDHPWKKNIMTTYFWVGEGASGYNSTTNYASAWDPKWTRNFGGSDSPKYRTNLERDKKSRWHKATDPGSVTLPHKFAPMRNPYYVALPFNDIKYPKMAAKWVPWWDAEYHKKHRWKSQVRGKWIMIEKDGNVCFAQWEDVGPFRYDHAAYIFGDERPNIHSKAGLDVSPAVRDYLGITGLTPTNWRFVEDHEVPYGPWLEYAEQAILFSAIKEQSKKAARTFKSKKRYVKK